jgi:MFS family permease
MATPLSSVRHQITLPVSLHPLREKNFGFFWLGSVLSSIGFWVQSVGQSWQVLQLTNSSFLLGLVVFAAMVPNIVLSLFGGVIADRVNRRYLLIGTQSIFMCTAALLGIFTTLHRISVWQIILMALINGTFNAVGIPAWQAFIGDLLEPEQLKQGIALNSMQFNLSRIIGPALGGISIGIFGIAGSYYLNAISYLAVIIPLLLIHPARKLRLSNQQGMWQDLREGLNYARKRPSLQVLLLLQFLIAFLVFPYAILLPVFARDIFHIGAPGLGLLNSASGVGALGGGRPPGLSESTSQARKNPAGHPVCSRRLCQSSLRPGKHIGHCAADSDRIRCLHGDVVDLHQHGVATTDTREDARESLEHLGDDGIGSSPLWKSSRWLGCAISWSTFHSDDWW